MPPKVLDYQTPRRRLAAALAAYMRGEIDNFALDDAVWAAAQHDQSLYGLAFTLWRTYDDVKRHSVRATRPGWQFLRRCVAYLLTNEPAPRKFRRRVDRWELWPFQSWAAVRAAAGALPATGLPRYDPALHGQPIRSAAETRGLYAIWVGIGLTALAALACWVGKAFGG